MTRYGISQLIRSLHPNTGLTKIEMDALTTFVKELDGLDGVKDGFVDTFWRSDDCKKGGPNSHDRLIDSKASLLAPIRTELKNAIITKAKQLLDQTVICDSARTLSQQSRRFSESMRGVVELKPGEMRRDIWEIKTDLKELSGRYTLEELGVDPTTAMGQKVMRLAELYKKDGNDAVFSELKKWPEQDRIEFAKYTYSTLPIRPDLKPGPFFKWALIMNFALYWGRAGGFFSNSDQIAKWKFSPKKVQAEINETSVMGSIVDWLGDDEPEFLKTFRASVFGKQMASFFMAYEDLDLKNPDEMYFQPEALTVVLEGILRVRDHMPAPRLTEQGKKDIVLVPYKDVDGIPKIVQFKTNNGVGISPEGQYWLSRILTAVHKIIPPQYNLQTGKIVDSPGPMMAINKVISRSWRIFKLIELRFGEMGPVGLDMFVSAILHEMGHYIYNVIIDKNVGQVVPPKVGRLYGQELDGKFKWDWSPKWSKKIKELYKNALDADAALFFTDALYDDAVPGVGHPESNPDEFFASSFRAYIMNADEIVARINNPDTPIEVRYYAMEMWDFLRDYVFHGTVFTKDGKDPFPI